MQRGELGDGVGVLDFAQAPGRWRGCVDEHDARSVMRWAGWLLGASGVATLGLLFAE